MLLSRFSRQYEQLSQFEKMRIIGMMEAAWSARRLARQLGHSDCVPTASLAVSQEQVTPSLGGPCVSSNHRKRMAEGHLGLRCPSDDNRVREWTPRGERLKPAFALQRHTTPTAGVMVWGVIAYITRSPLVLICGTTTTKQYFHYVMQPRVLPLMQWLPEAIFQQDNAQPHSPTVSQDCLRMLLPFLGLPDPQICFHSNISVIIWDGELGIPQV
ncbi:transposable element Tcb2 transposase [Trichonephila clavipes]|nr:transposable element Tcb2 transposase [Trichonephila clavipes]